MAFRFNVCQPCCGCCPDSFLEFDVRFPADFADELYTGFSQINGQLLTIGAITGVCGAAISTETDTFRIDGSAGALCLQACNPYTIGGIPFVSLGCQILNLTAGEQIAFYSGIYSLPQPYSYTVQKTGCAIVLAGNVSTASWKDHAATYSYSTALYTFEGIDAIAFDKPYTLPNRGLGGSGINGHLVGLDAGFNEICDCGTMATGGFLAEDATVIVVSK